MHIEHWMEMFSSKEGGQLDHSISLGMIPDYYALLQCITHTKNYTTGTIVKKYGSHPT